MSVKVTVLFHYRVMKEFLEKQSTVFDLCIEQLRPDLKTYYKSLAVFSEDVNIIPKVSIEDSLTK